MGKMSTLVLNIFFDVEITIDVETVHPRFTTFFLIGGNKDVFLSLVNKLYGVVKQSENMD